MLERAGFRLKIFLSVLLKKHAKREKSDQKIDGSSGSYRSNSSSIARIVPAQVTNFVRTNSKQRPTDVDEAHRLSSAQGTYSNCPRLANAGFGTGAPSDSANPERLGDLFDQHRPADHRAG